jgi:hypothetical protein
MFSINLLPVEKREELRWEINSRRLNFFFVGSVVVAVVFYGLLFSINKYISIRYDSLNEIVDIERSSASNKKVANLEDNIRKLNEGLTLIDKVESQKKDPVEILGVISASLPSDVILTRFSFNPENNTVLIAGISPTRAKLLLVEDSLKNYQNTSIKKPFFTNITYPIQNYVQQTDIAFNFSMELNK